MGSYKMSPFTLQDFIETQCTINAFFLLQNGEVIRDLKTLSGYQKEAARQRHSATEKWKQPNSNKYKLGW